MFNCDVVRKINQILEPVPDKEGSRPTAKYIIWPRLWYTA